MKNHLLLVASLLSVALGVSMTATSSEGGIALGGYLGQTPPGPVPRVFAPGVISLPDRYEYSIVFSPDLRECVFGVTDSSWTRFTLLYASMDADSGWSEPVTAPFLGVGDGLSPAYSHDGNSILFASSRPTYPPSNLWKAARIGDSGWSVPVMIPAPVSTSADEFSPCLDANGVLYFISVRAGGAGDADIYRSDPSGGTYRTVENLGAPINSKYLDSTPFIAPDGSYILFESDRPGGFGQQDLYISYREGDVWGRPANLGPGVNTEQIEDEAYVSPDGRYLFFNRRAAFVTPQQTDLYWVDFQAVVDSLSMR